MEAVTYPQNSSMILVMCNEYFFIMHMPRTPILAY